MQRLEFPVKPLESSVLKYKLTWLDIKTTLQEMSTSCFQFLWPKGFRLRFYLRDPSLVRGGAGMTGTDIQTISLFFRFSSVLSVLPARSLPLEGGLFPCGCGNRRKCVYVLKSCINTMATVRSCAPVGIGLLWLLSLV